MATSDGAASGEGVRPLRVLHTPDLVGGNASVLAAAERRAGLDSRCVALSGHQFGYSADFTMSRSLVGGELARPRLLRRALRWADVIHFNFGRSIAPGRVDRTRLDRDHPRVGGLARRLYNALAQPLEFRDVDILRRHDKTIAVTFQGTDIRQYDLLEPGSVLASETADQPAPDNELRRARVTAWNGRADLLFALNPDLLRLLPARASFLPYTCVNLNETPGSTARPREEILRVAHAPSNRAVKGTRFLLHAVEQLAREGVPIQLDLVEGVDHTSAMRRYALADVVVDQLVVGWYGALAVESMALGKPVIAHVSTRDLRMVPSSMERDLPIVRCDHRSVTDALRNVARMSPSQLRDIGERSKTFVARYHDPDVIARDMISKYQQAHASRAGRAERVEAR